MMFDRTLKLGTRSSALARWQAEWVGARLQACGYEVELVPVSTQGDVFQGPLAEAGGAGLFTKELQRALLDGRIDLAVHSLKDLPTDFVPGLVLGSVPPRASVRDALLSRESQGLADLRPGAIVGTGSLRRRAQLLHLRQDLRMADIRGNVDTRLRKLAAGECDALVLAEAGLTRLGLVNRVQQLFSPREMLPAVGQGALGIEIRTDDPQVRNAVAALNDPATHAAVLAERKLLSTLRGGCLAPVGAWARMLEDGRLHLDAVVLSPDGSERLTGTHAGELAEALDIGQRAADELLAQGATALIARARGG